MILAAIGATATLAGEPSPGLLPSLSPAELIEGGDPRSEGEGPGLVGSPLAILLGVVALGFVTAVITALLARLTQRR